MTKSRLLTRLALFAVLTAMLVSQAPQAAIPAGSGVPTYVNFSNSTYNQAGEPSAGVSWQDGTVMYQEGPGTWAVTIDSANNATWNEVTQLQEIVASISLSDPIGFIDTTTNRYFASEIKGNCSVVAFTDDNGANWTPSQGCGEANGVDHETIGGGPYASPKPADPSGSTYPNAVYYCAQYGLNGGSAPQPGTGCSRSTDGGLTFGPSVTVYNSGPANGANVCYSTSGHVKVAPNGTVAIPSRKCGPNNKGFGISADNGATWSVVKVPGSTPRAAAEADPSLAFASDSTLYYGMCDGDSHPKVSVRSATGTWLTPSPVDVGASKGIQQCEFAEMIAGDGDRAAMAFLGSTTAGDDQADPYNGVWHLYIATTYDRGATWTTVDATPTDPVQRGCISNGGTTTGTPVGGACNNRNLLDFNDLQVDKQGNVLAAYADGCIGCADKSASTDSIAAFAYQRSGKGLFAAYDTNTVDTTPPSQVLGLGGTAGNGTVSLSWSSATDNVGVDHYVVYQDNVDVAHTTATNKTIAGLANGTAYSFQISAVDAAGNEGTRSVAISRTPNASTDTTPPSQVTGLTGTPGNGTAALGWTAATDNVGVDHYVVFQDNVDVVHVTGTSATVSGLTNGTAYAFQVAAVDAAGNTGTRSTSVPVTPVAPPPPAADWRTFHANSARTGSTTGSATLATAPGLLSTLTPGGAVASSPLVADVDGDGKNEVITVSDATKPNTPIVVSAYNQGATGLQTKWSYSVPNTFPGGATTDGVGRITLGDLNGDGILEVAVVDTYRVSTPAATSNIGDLRFLNAKTGALEAAAPAGTISIGLPTHPVIGDINGDGINDLVVNYRVGTSTGSKVVGYYLAAYDFTSSFSTLFDTMMGTALMTASPALAELDSAHAGLELLVADDAAASKVWECRPSGSAAVCGTPLTINSYAHGISAADLNGDGISEVVVNCEDDNGGSGYTLQVLRTTPSLALAAGISDGFLYNTASLGDVTGDGKADIVNVAESDLRNEGDPFLAGDVTVRSFTGSSITQVGTLARASAAPGTSFGSAGGGALADVSSGDGGRPELVFGSEDGTVSVVKFSAAGAPSLLWSIPVASGAPFSPPAISDLNNDGKLDVVIGTADGRILVYGAPKAPATVPGAPTGLNATGGDNSVSLSWSAPASDGGASITGYKVSRSETSGTETFLANAATTSYTDPTAAEGHTYFYTVAATNSVGDSAASNEASASPVVHTAPDAPTGLIATGLDARVNLSWSPPAQDGGRAITSYSVYRGDSSGTETVLASAGSATTYSDTTVVNDQTYYYTVTATNSVGEGAQSQEVSATPAASTGSPDASASPASIDFGSLDVGATSSAQTVTVTNTGTAPLSVGTATTAGDFTKSGDACSGTIVAASGTCAIQVRFAPAASGARTGSLSIPSDASSGTATVDLSGTGLAPAVSLDASSLAFGSQNVGSTGAAQTVTLTNSGTATLNVGTASIAGTNPADFTRTADSCSATSVAPGGSCAVSVAFKPTAPGARAGSLRIPSNAPGSPATVALSGTGIDVATLTATPASQDFGSIYVGGTSAPRSVTIRNTGSKSAKINTVTLDGVNPDQFVLGSNTCTGTILTPGKTCSIASSFRPSGSGPASANITIASTADGSPLSVGLAGTGLIGSPKLSATPTTVSAGNQLLGTTGSPKSLTVKNIGTGYLAISAVALDGANPDEFASTSDTCTGKNIAQGATCVVKYAFTPTQVGPRSANVTITSNSTTAQPTLTLAGTGVADTVAPESHFDQTNNTVLLSANGHISGTITDGGSGVASAVLSGTSDAGVEVGGDLNIDCDAAKHSCTFSTSTPVIPGRYQMHVVATDVAGNVEDPGASVTLIIA